MVRKFLSSNIRTNLVQTLQNIQNVITFGLELQKYWKYFFLSGSYLFNNNLNFR